MSFFGACPRCGTMIPSERFINNAAVCECGWSDQTPQFNTRMKEDKKVVTIMIATAIFMIGFYAHLVSWGSYSMAIPFVKAQQITGLLSTEGYKELAQVCIDLGKYTCAQDAYTDLYMKKRDVEGLNGLAKLQMRLEQKPEALASYSLYFQYGGKDGDAAIFYAQLLDEAGRVDEAMKMFELSISLRPDNLPIIATTAIVRTMMKQGRYEEALDRILAFHDSAGNAKGYLNTELQQLETYVAKNGKKRKGIARN